MILVYIELFSLTMYAKALKLSVPFEPRSQMSENEASLLSTSKYNYIKKWNDQFLRVLERSLVTQDCQC